MGVFWAEVLSEAVVFIILVIVAVCGIFAGKALRTHKDSKKSSEEQA